MKEPKIIKILRIIVWLGILAWCIYACYQSYISYKYYYYSEMKDKEWDETFYYSGDKPKESLGKDPEDIDSSMYSLTGLSTSDYLYRCRRISFLFGGEEEEALLVSEDSEEPILIYDVKALEIDIRDEIMLTLKGEILSELLKIRREGVPQICEEPSEPNARAYFDLPCNLIFHCTIKKDADGIIHFVCYNNKSQEFYDYDVTPILKDYFG